MSSNSLAMWSLLRTQELDEIDRAHKEVYGNRGRGRLAATQQINHAYAVLLTSQFQGFCRDLHSEAVEYVAHSIRERPIRSIVQANLTLHRKLDQGNPNPGNIGADFNRFGMRFIDEIRARNKLNNTRLLHLELLNHWRNAIAHHDFDAEKLGGINKLTFATVRRWRNACEQLAREFDAAIGDHIAQITGAKPW